MRNEWALRPDARYNACEEIPMTLSLSVPFVHATYQRSFDAGIDVPAANELLVRGRLRDHRGGLEHVWRVRTPDYEVLDAAASQDADAQFDPALCARYAGIRGVRLGRGFTKRVTAELGDAPGASEQTVLAIEMARVSQQVYQFPPDFDARFPPIEGAGEAESAWRKDRAYLPELANSCYTYRDETAALFAARPVRLGFGGDLYSPRPGDKRVFWRTKQLSIAQTPDGRFACESAMDDRIHDIQIGFALSADGVISGARSRGLRLPYHGVCEDAQLRTARLEGLRVNAGFVAQFADCVGGAQGCTHLFDLSMDVLRLFRFSN
jgi:Protein of unknown function (DUF2889)